jgi:hypothetical protein
MRITVKTVEWLRHHLPGDPADNQAEIEVAQDATPESVITQLALSGTAKRAREPGARRRRRADGSAGAKSRHVIGRTVDRVRDGSGRASFHPF